ncbi:MAG: hypothetical protein ACP5SG_02665 [Dissulfurimicrobium sp.]|uniref:hypothetical protein n=1 Tax=Dissulfurimicrobium TaxID=1769732 RepID=UPI003C72CE3F
MTWMPVPECQDVAILYSGGTDSLSLYALAFSGRHPLIPRPRRIHLLHMLNGMGRFPAFPKNRMRVAKRILAAQAPEPDKVPKTSYVELDMGRLFQGLWLDVYEDLMPKYGGKNLVCVACKLAMHARGIIYCVEHLAPTMFAGYTKKQGYYPEQTYVFMEKTAHLSKRFGIRTAFPLYEDLDIESVGRHLLEDLGLPSTGGGERKCLFCQTKTSATEKEIGAYLDDMFPMVSSYIEYRLEGRIKDAAMCFPPGRDVSEKK